MTPLRARDALALAAAAALSAACVAPAPALPPRLLFDELPTALADEQVASAHADVSVRLFNDDGSGFDRVFLQCGTAGEVAVALVDGRALVSMPLPVFTQETVHLSAWSENERSERVQTSADVPIIRSEP